MDENFNEDLKLKINNFIWMYGKPEWTLEESEEMAVYLFKKMFRG